jgi:hypothetical protein
LGDRLCVVVGTDCDEGVPDDHLAVWFGPSVEGGPAPEVYTVPANYFEKAPPPNVKH